MKFFLYFITFAGLALTSCDRSIIGFSLDDLNDQDELTGVLEINCEYYMDQKVDYILVNRVEHQPDEPLSLSESGFYRIEIFRKRADPLTPDVIRIVIFDEVRGEAEWGLKKWTPNVVATSQIDDREISLVYPKKVPDGVHVPLMVLAKREMEPSIHKFQASLGSSTFNIKQGIGSFQIPVDELNGAVLIIDQRSFPIETESFESTPLALHGVLLEDTYIPAGTFVRIGEDLTIPEGLTMTIDSGAFITITPGTNIYNEGTLRTKGSQENPVTFTCSEPGSFWGGIIGTTPGNHIEALYTIFCFSGFHTDGNYNYGHAHRQALIYSENGILSFDHCYMIDHAGQVFYPVSAAMELNNSLIQRAMTGGQVNNSELTIHNTVFTDFPDDSQNYRDEDNDCLYLMGSNATISNSLFMYAKDDGLDSGGSGGGEISVVNTYFMAIFHEGAALSSGGTVTKSHVFTRCSFTNCGQGIELGYSSPNHLVIVDSCIFQENGIGIRYGDNYVSQHQGEIVVSNSASIYNLEHDIWNMVRDSWSADTFNMEFVNVTVSRENLMYPQLKLYE